MQYFNKNKKYLDGVSTSAMAGSHVAVALCDSGGDGEVPVLTVHVVGARPRVITQPNTEVFHFQWAFFIHLKVKMK